MKDKKDRVTSSEFLDYTKELGEAPDMSGFGPDPEFDEEKAPVAKVKPSNEKFSLLKEYRNTRNFLSGDPTSLELKHEGRDLMEYSSEEFREGLFTTPRQEL